MRLGIVLMPKIYESMGNLTSLRLYFQRSPDQSRPAKIDSRDLFKILTGCEPDEIPKDESMWPKFLVGKNRYSMTSLKSKKIVKIQN